MTTCSVPICDNNIENTGENVIYHRFPEDEGLCNIWFEKCSLTGQIISRNSVVCSSHFTEDDYERDLKEEFSNLPLKRVLRDGAVPSVSLPPADDPLTNNEVNLETDCKVFIMVENPMVLNSCISGTVLTVAQFPELCRSCLSRSDNTSIFNLNFEGLDFQYLFEICCTMKITKDDGLPQNICQKCINDIVYIYKFMIKCKESDSILRTILDQVNNEIVENIKAEPNDDEESTSPVLLCENIDYQSGEKSDNDNFNTENVTKMLDSNTPKCTARKNKKASDLNNKKKNITVTCTNCDYTADTYKKLSIHCRQTGHGMPKRHKCEYCEKFFMTPSKVTNHIKSVHLKEKPYECEICEFKFSTKFTLRRHMMTHTETKPYTCEICGIGFREKSSLQIHRRKHSDERPFICSYCGKNFASPKLHKRHERKHELQDILNKKDGSSLEEQAAKHPVCTAKKKKKASNLNDKKKDATVVCTNCDYRIGSYRKLAIHCRQTGHSMPKRHQCEYCEKFFVSRHIVAFHIKLVHLKVKPHECEICRDKFSTRFILRRHMMTHTEEKPHACEICGFKCRTKFTLQNHMMTHTGNKRHMCEICGIGFGKTSSLENHLEKHSGETPFICSHCGKGFINLKIHKQHERKHEIQDILNEKDGTGLAEKAAKRPDLFDKVCTICGKFFSTKYILRRHLLMHQDIYAYLCSECGKGFTTKTGLENHSVVHTGARPYTCEICHKSFAQASVLYTHQVVHKEERPYKCKICTKSFKLKAQLTRHLIMHSGKKTHSCNFCEKKFALKENLKAHMRIHSGEAAYVCDVCGKRFYHNNNRKKHMKVHNSVKDIVK